ncbi:MAG: hypothetical protein E6X43_13770 [Peptostreptococcaceae bacterium]|nr:hypothetical protein [Peptostreptococcaceae bacterium]
MKKYKTIDFIKLYTPNRKNVKIVYILVALIMVIGVYKVNMNQKRNTKIYNEETVLDENIDITESDEESIYINFDNIKVAFNLIGKENINRILVDNSGIEIEGECNNLDILEQLRNKSNSSYFSINSLLKQDNKYIFNLKYNTGE